MYDVGQGPVVFEKSFAQVPKPPTPGLGNTGTYVPGKGMFAGAVAIAVAAAVAAVLKGEKADRPKNAKLLAITTAFGVIILVPSLLK